MPCQQMQDWQLYTHAQGNTVFAVLTLDLHRRSLVMPSVTIRWPAAGRGKAVAGSAYN